MGTDNTVKRYPPPTWTPGHRMITMIATPDLVITYDQAIRCPSSWTPDHWMNAISPIAPTSYDEPSGVQAWTPEAVEPRDAIPMRLGLTCNPNQVNSLDFPFVYSFENGHSRS